MELKKMLPALAVTLGVVSTGFVFSPQAAAMDIEGFFAYNDLQTVACSNKDDQEGDKDEELLMDGQKVSNEHDDEDEEGDEHEGHLAPNAINMLQVANEHDEDEEGDDHDDHGHLNPNTHIHLMNNGAMLY